MKTQHTDYETTEFDHRYGQPLSNTSAIYDNGKLIDKLETNCRMEKWKLPSPYALLINNYPIKNLKQSQSKRDMMRDIYRFNNKHEPMEIYAHNAHFDSKFDKL